MDHSKLETLFFEVCADLQGACLEDLARQAECSYSTLLNWRKGVVRYPRASTLCRIASTLGYSITWYKDTPR